jgi:quinol monooxygenase YgiN
MEKFALLGLLKAKPGKESELEQFLKSALALAQAEPGTDRWYAVKMGADRFGIFDTFPDAAARDAHLGGEIAKALFARADELLAEPPQIERLEILAAKAA